MENERIRSQRVDDAMLIEQLRLKIEEIKEVVNGVIGTIVNCTMQMNEIGGENITKEIEQVYEIGS